MLVKEHAYILIVKITIPTGHKHVNSMHTRMQGGFGGFDPDWDETPHKILQEGQIYDITGSLYYKVSIKKVQNCFSSV